MPQVEHWPPVNPNREPRRPELQQFTSSETYNKMKNGAATIDSMAKRFELMIDTLEITGYDEDTLARCRRVEYITRKAAEAILEALDSSKPLKQPKQQ